ncbi:hypothetical protein HPB47_007939 [Ixodes persulcatus]|uniref:Uncharacterized protein n=1 Tax=Ixodes persulcatus TaxID=34615 RepID=A0AC60P6Z6_IXOPE|nr:hypothetical protein HPB47_007939 [Ixodes persulcatus]
MPRQSVKSQPTQQKPQDARVEVVHTQEETISAESDDSKDAKEKPRFTTLVGRNLPGIEHDIGISTVEHVLIEIISNTKSDGRSVFVLSVYSSPSRSHRFAVLFRATLEIAKQKALVVIGDFNAPHPDWGYLTETDKASGSDHFVAAVTVIAGPGKPKGRRIRITDWDAFRRCQQDLGRAVARLLDCFDHQLGAPNTWKFLRNLLDPDGTKTAQKNKMSEILRRHYGNEDDIMEEIRKRYIRDSPPRAPMEYDGERNTALDVPITEGECNSDTKSTNTQRKSYRDPSRSPYPRPTPGIRTSANQDQAANEAEDGPHLVVDPDRRRRLLPARCTTDGCSVLR